MPGLPLTMDAEESSQEDRPLNHPHDKPASQNLITNFFKPPKKPTAESPAKTNNILGYFKKAPDLKAEHSRGKTTSYGGLIGEILPHDSCTSDITSPKKTTPDPGAKPKPTASLTSKDLDHSLEDFVKADNTRKQPTKSKQTKKKTTKVEQTLDEVHEGDRDAKESEVCEELEISYEDFLKSVGSNEDSVILVDDNVSEELCGGILNGNAVTDGVNTTTSPNSVEQERNSSNPEDEACVVMEVSSEDIGSTKHLVTANTDRMDCEEVQNSTQISIAKPNARIHTKVDYSRDGPKETETNPSVTEEHLLCKSDTPDVEDCDQKGAAQSVKPKTKSKGIAMFFSKVDKKAQSKKDNDSTTITVRAEVHPEPDQNSTREPDDVVKAGSRKSLDQEMSPSGQRRSNVVVDSCDLTITHLDSTIITLTDKKSKGDSDKKPEDKTAVKVEADSCIIISDDVPVGQEQTHKAITEKKMTENEEEKERRMHEESKRIADQRKQTAAQLASLDKVKVKLSTHSRQGTLSFGARGLTTVKPPKAPGTSSMREEESTPPPPLESSQPKLLSPPRTSSRATRSSQTPSKSAETEIKVVCGNAEKNNESPIKAYSVKKRLTSTPKPKGKGTKKYDLKKSETAEVVKRRGRSVVVRDVEAPVEVDRPMTISVGQTIQTFQQSEEALEVFTSTLLPGEPAGVKTRRASIKMRITRLRSQKPFPSEEGDFILSPEAKSKQQKVTRAQQLLQKAKSVNSKKASKPVTTGKKSRLTTQTTKPVQGPGTMVDTASSLRRSCRKSAHTAKVAIAVSLEMVDKSRRKRKLSEKSENSDIEVVKEEMPNKCKKLKEGKPGKKSTASKKAPLQMASIFRKKGVVPPSSLAGSGSNDDRDAVVVIKPEVLQVRRQFLMSGVPEELRKQRLAAEICLSYKYAPFPDVSHVRQCPTSPEDSNHALRVFDPWHLPNVSLPLRESSSCPETRTEPVYLGTLIQSQHQQYKVLFDKNPQVTEIPADVKAFLLAEISRYNPMYPVRRVFRHLTRGCQAKRDRQSETTEDQSCKVNTITDTDETSKGKKRKLSETEGKKMSEEMPKRRRRRRGGSMEEDEDTHAPLRRSSRSAARRESSDDCKILDGETPEIFLKFGINGESKESTSTDGCLSEPQWTDKYQPLSGAEVLGNAGCVRKLKTWLVDWIQRTDLEMKRARKQIMKVAKRAGKSKEELKKEIRKKLGSEWWMDDVSDFELDTSDEDSDEEETDSLLCNTVCVSGPHGIGKTAMVYALAKELGYKVFEVNSSNRRNGKQLLAQLQEATQSHQVSKKNLDSLFTSSMAVQALDKVSHQNGPAKPEKKLPSSFAKFFKKSNCGSDQKSQGTSQASSKTSSQVQKLDASKTGKKKTEVDVVFTKECFHPAKKLSLQIPGQDGDDCANSKKGLNLSSTSLILFEEVDVVFEEDKGFWAAIQTFMSTTKRPIILTTSHPEGAAMVGGRHEELRMRTPPLVNIASHLQVLCLAENVRSDFSDLLTLVTHYKGNLRQCILGLQFWVLSGGGTVKEDVPIKYQPNFFSDKKANTVESSPALCRARESFRPFAAHLGVEVSRDSSDEFERDSPKIARRRRGRAIIEDDSSRDSVGASPAKLEGGRLQELHEEDSQGSQETGDPSLRPLNGGEDEFLQADVPQPPPVHKLCHESLTSPVEGQHNFLTILKERVIGSSGGVTAGFEDYLNENTDIVYNNLPRLLCLPHTEAVRRPAPLPTNPKSSQPKQRKRIKCATELFDSDESVDDCFISLSRKSQIGQPSPGNRMLEDGASVEGDGNDDKPPQRKISAEDRILYKSVKSLSDMYDQFSSIDAHLIRPSGHREGSCSANTYIWSPGQLTPGLTSQGTRHDDQSNTWLPRAAAADVQRGIVTKANYELKVALDKMHLLGSKEREGLQEKMSLPTEKCQSFRLQSYQEPSFYRRLGVSHLRSLEYVSSLLPSHVQCQKRALAMDYMPSLRAICQAEQLRRATNTKRRFLHYMDYISLPVTRKQSVIDTLCSSFT